MKSNKFNILWIFCLLAGVTIFGSQSLSSQEVELIPVKQPSTNTYGYKEKGKDEWAILPTYEEALPFKHRIAIVKKNGQCYTMDMHERQLSPTFSYIQSALAGFIACRAGETCKLYDLAFNPISDQPIHSIFYTPTGYTLLFRIQQGYKTLWGIMNAQGNILVPPIYNDLVPLTLRKASIKYDGILPEEIANEENGNLYFYAQDNNWKSGIIDLSHEILIPFKYNSSSVYTKGAQKYLSSIKTRLASGLTQQVGKQCQDAYERMLAKTAAYVASLPSDYKHAGPVVVQQVEGGYQFQRDGQSIDGVTYTNLIEEDSLYIAESAGKYGIKDIYGQTILPVKFDGLLPWNEVDGKPIYLTIQGDQFQLYDTNGEDLLYKSYDFISSIVANRAYVIDKNGYLLISDRGYEYNLQYYENIEIADNGTVTASRLGYQTTLDEKGYENPSIASLIFNEAYNEKDTQRQLERYQLAIDADPENEYGIQAKALNNIGIIYESNGKQETALAFYDQARDKGNDLAADNANRLRTAIRQAKIDGVVNALNQLSQAIGGSSGTPTGQATASPYTNLDQASTSGNGSGHSIDYYQRNYDNYEKTARMAYETLTNTGYKTSDKNGKAKGGSSAGSFSTAHYSSIKRNLRNAQNKMREWRRQARQAGYTIVESEYESVTVSF